MGNDMNSAIGELARLTIALISGFLLVSPAIAGDDSCKLIPVATLPMQLMGGRPTVPASVEGKSIQMLVDTGGAFSELSFPLVLSLKLQAKFVESRKIYAFGGNQEGLYVVSHAFALGTLTSSKQEFVISSYSVRGIDGSLAPDILRAFDVDFDFGHGKFNLISQKHCEGRVAYWSDEAARIPISIDAQGHIRFTLMVDGKTFSAILDTGATKSTLSLEDAESAFGFVRDDPAIQPAGVVNGSVQAYRYPFKTLTLGGLSVNNPQILLISEKDSKMGSLPSFALGVDVLNQLHLYVAYGESAIYLTAAAAH
jgi:predicted aspartyl protease